MPRARLFSPSGIQLSLKVFVLLCVTWLLWGCGHGGGPHPQAQGQSTIRVKDDLGQIVTLSHPPQRIVSLAPNTTEILYALGLGDRIVAVGDFSDYPLEAKKKPSVGRYDRPSLEKIVSYRPDLVFIGFGSSKDLAPAVAKAGAASFAVNPQSIAQILDAIKRIGNVCGVDSRASKLAADLKHRIQAVKSSLQTQSVKRPRVFIMLDNESLWTAGPETLQDEILRLAGGQNIATRPSFYQISKESLVDARPDVILVPLPSQDQQQTRDAGTRSAKLFASEAKVITVDADAFSRPGPRVVDAVEELAKALKK
jgi:iron complex transport system substrate-binding protein